MAINLAEKYSSKIDEAFVSGSLSDGGVNKNYDFVGAKTVKVYSAETAPLNDYNTNGGMQRYGVPQELQDNIQELTMSQAKSFTFTIDKTHEADSPEGIRNAAQALRRQVDQVIIPEIDRYRFAVIADGAGTKTVETVSGTTAYSSFLNANAAIDEKEMPTDGRIAYVTPVFYNLIKKDDSFVKATEIGQTALIKGQVGEIDGVRIVKIPSKRMPAGASFIITNPIAATAPVKLQEYQIHSNPPGIAGHLVEGLVYHDAFVLNQKKGAIAVHYGVLGALTASMTETAAGKGAVYVSGNTNGGKIVYKAAATVAAVKLGDDVSAWSELPKGGEIEATAGHKYAVAVSVDGKAVAASVVGTVSVGA